MKIKNVEIKGTKEFPGREGTAVCCSIHYKGKRIGEYIDYADGGECRLETISDQADADLKKAAHQYFTEFPPYDFKGKQVDPNSTDAYDLISLSTKAFIEKMLFLHSLEKLLIRAKKAEKNPNLVLGYIEDAGICFTGFADKSKVDDLKESLMECLPIRANHYDFEREPVIYSLESFNIK